jgi:hypothetical protein
VQVPQPGLGVEDPGLEERFDGTSQLSVVSR